MKKLIPLLLLLCCCTSCVTLFNRKTTKFVVGAGKGAEILYHKEYKGVRVRGHKVVQLQEGEPMPQFKTHVSVIEVKRSQTEMVPVTVRKDGLEKTVFVKPVHSFKYWMNFAHIYPLLSFGFLIDHNNPNRFGYPRYVYLDMADTSPRYYSYMTPPGYVLRPRKPGYFSFDFSPPLVNVYLFNLEHLDPGASPFGIAGSLGYHYGVHKFVSLECGIAAVGPVAEHFRPDSSRVAQYGLARYERKSGWYVNVKDNYDVGRFELGYGLSLSSREGQAYYTRLKGDDSVGYHRRDIGLGVVGSAYFRFFSFFTAGLTFQPQLVKLNDGARFDYSYVLGFGVKLRFNLSRRK